MRCGRCARILVEIRVRIGGADVTLCRCAHCDSQAWRTPDGEIVLDEVLDRGRDSSRARRGEGRAET